MQSVDGEPGPGTPACGRMIRSSRLRPSPDRVAESAAGTALQSAGSGGSGPEPSEARHSAIHGYRVAAIGEAVTDACCLMLTFAILHLVNVDLVPGGTPLPVVVLSPVVWVAVFYSFGLYRLVDLPAADEFRRIPVAATVGIAVILLAMEWWSSPVTGSGLVLTWLVALFLELVARRLWRWWLRHSKRRGALALRTLVIGTNEEARRIAEAIGAPVRGFVPVAYVATDGHHASASGQPVIRLADIERAIDDLSVECLFVASSAVSPEQVTMVARLCRRLGLEFRVSANVPDVLASRLTVQPVEDVIVLSVKPAQLTRVQAALKRVFDLVLATIAFVLAAPLMGVIAIAILVSSRGPILFRQSRVTKGGRIFTIYKFRTMVVDPDQALSGKFIDLTQPFFKLKDDPRLTTVGRFLRAWSLDELPQLWNVIRGDMSLVGPRPLPREQVDAQQEELSGRHEVPAGITGWWQISGRSDVEYERALQLDLFYIENWSVGLDLYILLKTVGVLVARRGAW
jgi:exopolysaccharide biosynthesis polyprenyl glycosylphosphotransferase